MRRTFRMATWRCGLAGFLIALVGSLPVISEAAPRKKARRTGSEAGAKKPSGDPAMAREGSPEEGVPDADPGATPDPRIEELAQDEATFQQNHARRMEAVEARLAAVKRHSETLTERRARWNELRSKEEELALKEAELRASFAELLREMQETRLDQDPPGGASEEQTAPAPVD